MNKKHEGSTLADFLAEEGILEKCTETAVRRVRDYQSEHPEKITEGVDTDFSKTHQKT